MSDKNTQIPLVMSSIPSTQSTLSGHFRAILSGTPNSSEPIEIFLMDSHEVDFPAIDCLFNREVQFAYQQCPRVCGSKFQPEVHIDIARRSLMKVKRWYSSTKRNEEASHLNASATEEDSGIELPPDNLRREKFKEIIQKLENIQKILDYDRKILKRCCLEDIKQCKTTIFAKLGELSDSFKYGRTSERNKERSSEIKFLGIISAFYSDSEDERNSSYKRIIEAPLLHLFRDASEASYKFPKPLGWLYNAYTSQRNSNDQTFFQVALRDILNDNRHLQVLKVAFEEMRKQEKFSEGTEKQLTPFYKLASYFHDRSAIQRLISITSIFEHCDDVNSLSTKLAAIRIIQKIGEFYRDLSKATLNFNPKLPKQDLVWELRTKSSHLTKSRLMCFLYVSKENEIQRSLFQNLIEDIKQFHQELRLLEQRWTDQFKSSDQEVRWSLWKDLSNDLSGSATDASWGGLVSLQEDLKTSVESSAAKSSTQKCDPVEIECLRLCSKYKNLAHYQEDKKCVRAYQKRRDQVIQSLPNKKFDELKQILENHANSFQFSLNDQWEESLTLFIKKRDSSKTEKMEFLSQRKNQKVNQISKLIKERTASFMNELFDQGKYSSFEKEVTAVDHKIAGLKRLLNGKNWKKQRFSYLSFRYSQFVDALEKEGITLPDNEKDYCWMREPTLVEKLFYKVSKISWKSLKEKITHQAKQIESLIDFIEILRKELGVQDDIDTEIDQEERFTNFARTYGGHHRIKQSVMRHPRSTYNPRKTELRLENVFKNSELSSLTAEFLMSAIYEILKEIKDFPCLSVLQKHEEIRNFYDHPDLGEKNPLIVNEHDTWIYLNEPKKTLAQEVARLCINVKHILSTVHKELNEAVDPVA